MVVERLETGVVFGEVEPECEGLSAEEGEDRGLVAGPAVVDGAGTEKGERG